MALTDALKRSFARQIQEIMDGNKELLKKVGFDVESKVKDLQEKNKAQEVAEQEQLKAQAEAQAKTEVSKEALKAAYTQASDNADAMVGLLGKSHTLSRKLRQIRDAMQKEALRGRKKAAS